MEDQRKLHDASGHLFYEYMMFHKTFHFMVSGLIDYNQQLHNAVYESFLVHSRILIDFLYDEGRRSDDVSSEHFVIDTEKWTNERPDKNECIEIARTRANKLVAHLTYSRSKILGDERESEIGKIWHEINRVFDLFLDNIDWNKMNSVWDQIKDSKKI